MAKGTDLGGLHIVFFSKGVGHFVAMAFGFNQMGPRVYTRVPCRVDICKSRHEPIGVRGFLRDLGRFFKILGLRERTKEEKHM